MSTDESSSSAAVVQQLVSHYKKSGQFDATRRQLLRDFESSEEGQALRERLRGLVDDEVRRDPSLVAGGSNRSKATAVVSQAVDRSTLHADVRKSAEAGLLADPALRDRVATQVRQRHDDVKGQERQNAADDFMSKMGG